MKTKVILFFVLLLINCSGYSQYILVRARYTDTRLVDDAPNPPKRENHLILSFFETDLLGNVVPVSLTDYDLWVWKEGYQYHSAGYNAYDSNSNNMPGYNYPAPKAVAYYNSFGLNYIECDPNRATHFIVNGHELDCGYITVSHWGFNELNGLEEEMFPAPNICLPFYFYPSPYTWNLNFYPEPYGSYTWYNYLCNSNWNQFVVRGVLGQDTGSSFVPLPVRFANVKGEIDNTGLTKISWSNMTETDVLRYEVEMSLDGINFLPIDTILPTNNFGGQADYSVGHIQTDHRAYYRIRATENNGSHFYSAVIALTFGRISPPELTEQFTVYPNPVIDGSLTIQLTNAKKGRYVLSVIDQQGKAVKLKMVEHNGGDVSMQVELAGLLPGVYNVIFWSMDKKYSQKIMYVH